MDKTVRFVRRKSIENALIKLKYDKSPQYQAKRLFAAFRSEFNNNKLKQVDPGALPVDFVVETFVNSYGFDEEEVNDAFGIKKATHQPASESGKPNINTP